ncbi:hypothetical protein FB45DRAFT_1051148 [Roridomyces roridus]|uniref:Uncharacterized protein n=1 Tax=Roridomyces roridus TaxID=1738132 RepID=A0AAD7CL19_9AGAR|nr:hypothetical protein FB45DRAFT_1051148 [Roridomyces roridus]
MSFVRTPNLAGRRRIRPGPRPPNTRSTTAPAAMTHAQPQPAQQSSLGKDSVDTPSGVASSRPETSPLRPALKRRATTDGSTSSTSSSSTFLPVDSVLGFDFPTLTPTSHHDKVGDLKIIQFQYPSMELPNSVDKLLQALRLAKPQRPRRVTRVFRIVEPRGEAEEVEVVSLLAESGSTATDSVSGFEDEQEPAEVEVELLRRLRFAIPAMEVDGEQEQGEEQEEAQSEAHWMCSI